MENTGNNELFIFRKRQNFLFGLPFQLFSDGEIRENERFQRRIPSQRPNIPSSSNPYLSANGKKSKRRHFDF